MPNANNPFFKRPTVVQQAIHPRSKSEKLVNSSNEFNASSIDDLKQTLLTLIESASKGTEFVEQSDAESQEIAFAKRQELVHSAFHDSDAHIELGYAIASEIKEAGDRVGFYRRFLGYQSLTQGSVPMIELVKKNVTAFFGTSPTRIESQIVRDDRLYPDEFYVRARPFVEQRDIARSNSDILGRKYRETFEQTVVVKDRLWRELANACADSNGGITQVLGYLAPEQIALLHADLTDRNLPIGGMLVSSDITVDFIARPEWAFMLLDEVSKSQIVTRGKLGSIFGVPITTDAFRLPNHKVLEQGEVFVVAQSEYHGQYTDRGGFTILPIDESTENVPGKGWVFNELISMTCSNLFSVKKLVRLRM